MCSRFGLVGVGLTLMCSCSAAEDSTSGASSGGGTYVPGASGGVNGSGAVGNTGGGATTGGTGAAGSDPGAGGSTVTVNCERAGLEAAAESAVAALQAGDPSLMPLAASVTYEENEASAELGQGVWAEPIPVDFHRNLLDVQKCGTFTEVISANSSHQYVLGVRLQITDAEISAITMVATDEGDWLFDADAYLQYSSSEDWSLVPEGERLPYDELADVGYAYFRYWGDKSEPVPWGIPCARLEGGAYTGDYANSTCDVGVPDEGFAPQPYDDLTDVDYGMTVVLLNLGGADSHLFRVLTTGIRYVHTLTEQ
jgi:hypothetical protein